MYETFNIADKNAKWNANDFATLENYLVSSSKVIM